MIGFIIYLTGVVVSYIVVRRDQKRFCEYTHQDYGWDNVLCILVPSLVGSWISALIFGGIALWRGIGDTKPPKWL